MTTTNMFLNFGGKWDSPPLARDVEARARILGIVLLGVELGILGPSWTKSFLKS